ncbi:MAG TPA: biotin/lipoyl-containing protein [Candidatus Limnocylindria bacterium]|nr:biotin/lipoyl-containing protein [Candidatus Limnocylindria bacterium]
MTDHDDPAIAAVDLLAPAFSESGLDELELELGELRVRLARPRAATPVTPVAQPGGLREPTAPASRGGGQSPFGEPAPGMRFVVAPLTGVWYASPSPGARPYVQPGDEIAPGRVVGLIEAMKLFNEIKADVAGRVRRVLAENGTLVKRQQPLVEVES